MQLYGLCWFCSGAGFNEPFKYRCGFCGGSGQHFGYQQGLHDLYFHCAGFHWESNTNWFKSGPTANKAVSSWFGVNFDDGRDGVFDKESVQRIQLPSNNLVKSIKKYKTLDKDNHI